MENQMEKTSMLTGLQEMLNIGGWDSKISVSSNKAFDNYYTVQLFKNGLPSFTCCGLTFDEYLNFRLNNQFQIVEHNM